MFSLFFSSPIMVPVLALPPATGAHACPELGAPHGPSAQCRVEQKSPEEGDGPEWARLATPAGVAGVEAREAGGSGIRGSHRQIAGSHKRWLDFRMIRGGHVWAKLGSREEENQSDRDKAGLVYGSPGGAGGVRGPREGGLEQRQQVPEVGQRQTNPG